jgi:4-amino-4-deoxy-L-arabinose transferase-like glycosyltransferase
LLGVVKAYHGAGGKAWLLVGLSLGLGVLAKGPVILIHVLPVALMMPLWAKGRQESPLWHWYISVVLAVLVALAVVGTWLFPVYLGGNKAYLYEILWHQSAGRIADSFAHSHPPWFYPVVLPLFLWPWAWLGSRGESLLKAAHLSDPGLRFCLAWFISALLIFSMIDGKQPQYLLPELPAFALAAARVLTFTPGQPADPSRLRRILVSLPPMALVGWLMVELLVGDVSSAPVSVLLPMIAMGVAVLLASLALLLHRGASSNLLAWGAVGPGAVLALHIMVSPALFADYDGEAVAGSLAKFDGRGIAAYRSLENGELTFAGRLEHPVTLIESEASLRDWIVQHPCGAVVDRDAAMPQMAGLSRPETGFSFRRHAYRVFPVEGSGCLSLETTGVSGNASADRRIFLPAVSHL